MGNARDTSKRKASEHLIRTVKQTISDHRMLEFGESVLLAVSGGPDSIVLSHALHSIAAEYGLRLGVAHLNHQLRGDESQHDADFVAEFSRKLALPFYSRTADVRRMQRKSHMSLEEAAREARYAFLATVAGKHRFDKVATGHQGNDNAEAVLLNLLRGTGPLGLSGIRPIRSGAIIRPLIRLQRFEIMNYINEEKLPYVTDTSNSNLSFRRNRIRHHLIPEIEKHHNSAIIAALNRLGNIMQAEDQWIDSLIQPEFDHSVRIEKPDTVAVDLERMADLAKAAKRRLIRKAIFTVKNDLRRITLQHIDSVLHLADMPSASGCLSLPDSIRVVKRDSTLKIGKDAAGGSLDSAAMPKALARDYHYVLNAPGVLPVEEAGVTLKLTEVSVADLPAYSEAGKDLAFFDKDRLQFPLVVRNVRSGDRFSPLGVKGSQKVKKYFIDHKIPVSRRRICPLLVCRDKIIWIAGHRIDNSVKIVPTTKRVLRAELLLA